MTQAINRAMIGELKHIDEAFDIRETLNFAIDQFKGCNNSNLEEIVTLYETVGTTSPNIFSKLNK